MTDVYSVLAGLCVESGEFSLTATLAEERCQVSRLTWCSRPGGAIVTIHGALDQEVLEIGSKVVLDRIVLELDAASRPVHYERQSGGQGLSIAFEADKAHASLSDGATFEVECANLDAVLDGNAPALTALLLRRSFAYHGSVAQRSQVFIARHLLPFSYSVAEDPEGRWQSNLEESIAIDDEGRLRELFMPRQSLLVREATESDLTLLEEVPRTPAPSKREANPALETREFQVKIPGGAVTALIRSRVGTSHGGTVLILPGSGRTDRFGRVGSIDTGLGQIAESIALSGHAAMSADQPGAGDSKLPTDALSGGYRSNLLMANALLDAALAQRKSAEPVILVGHSLGGVVALELAVKRPDDIAALVLLAAPGRPLDRVIEDQIRWIGKRRGIDPDTVDQQVAEHRELITMIRTVPEWTSETVPERFLAQIRTRDWLAGLIDADPAELVAKVRCPVFVAQGDRDVQVGVDQDFARLAAARPGLETHLYSNLNHLFRHASKDEGITGYDRTDAPVSAALIEDLTRFVEEASSAGEGDL